jgi:hypothetical protein
MPRTKDHEKNRLKKARLKKLSRFPKNAKLKRPSDPEQAKEWLREVADHLSNHLNAGPCFRFVAYAIKKYLRHPKTLDLASELTLIYPPGRPRTFKERTEEQRRARRTHKLRQAGKNMNQISKILKVPYRTLVRTYEKYLPDFEKEEAQSNVDRDFRTFLRSQRKPS